MWKSRLWCYTLSTFLWTRSQSGLSHDVAQSPLVLDAVLLLQRETMINASLFFFKKKKPFNWGLASSFRDLVFFHHGMKEVCMALEQ